MLHSFDKEYIIQSRLRHYYFFSGATTVIAFFVFSFLLWIDTCRAKSMQVYGMLGLVFTALSFAFLFLFIKRLPIVNSRWTIKDNTAANKYRNYVYIIDLTKSFYCTQILVKYGVGYGCCKEPYYLLSTNPQKLQKAYETSGLDAFKLLWEAQAILLPANAYVYEMLKDCASIHAIPQFPKVAFKGQRKT